MKTNYSYQQTAADQILKNLYKSNTIASVLAAAPGAGKTTISHIVINNYIAKNPSAKVLVLTEGQNVLKSQYLDELANSNVVINFQYGDLNSDAQVRIGLPQSIASLGWSKIDLLVVDEAHHFYTASTVQNIIRSLKPEHQVLMTGSPTEFNLHNQKSSGSKYAIHYIAADDLKKIGVFSGVNLDVVRTSDIKNSPQVLRDVFSSIVNNKDNADKIMIACDTIEQAKSVAASLGRFNYKVSLSTSENDTNNEEIKKFKANETNALVVVGKGILGFNDSNITCMIDLKQGSNLDATYQLFARVLRKHPKQIKKTYYKVCVAHKYNHTVLFLHKMVSLMKRDIFTQYNGKNLDVEVTI